MTIDPFHVRRISEWSDADFDLEDLELPAAPQWNRCGAVHCIDRGPWIGTLVCCIRRSGHEDGHSMSLGDEGLPTTGARPGCSRPVPRRPSDHRLVARALRLPDRGRQTSSMAADH